MVSNEQIESIVTSGSAKTTQSSVKQRIAALKATDDISLLLDAYCHDTDDLVIDCADMRLRDVLCKIDGESAHSALLHAPLSLKTRKVLAASAHAEPLRYAMLEHLDDDQSLSEVIAHSDDWRIKAAAIARLNDTEALKIFIKQYKGKKKTAYRTAKTRLDTLKAQQKIIEELQSRLATLITSAESQTLTAGAVIQFEQLLNQHLDSLTADEQRIFSTPLPQLQQSAADIAQAKDVRHAILRQLENTYDALQQHTFAGTQKDFHALMNRCQQDWANLPDWQAAESKALNIRLEQLLSRTNHAAGQYFKEKQQQSAQKKLLSQAQRWLDTKVFVTADMLLDIDRRWATLVPPTDAEAARHAQQQFNEYLIRLREKAQQQQTAQQANDNAVPALLTQLQTALDEGKTQQSVRLHHSIREHINSDAKLSKPVYQRIITPLKQLEHRLSELKRWQHFGDDQVRQELIDAMQALSDNTQLPITDKAEQIQTLQKRWKRLKGHAPSAQWTQFKTLGDTAWQPVSAYFQAQRQASKNDLAARLTFLREAEQQLQTIDWNKPNWDAVNATHKQFEKLWRSFPKLQEHDYRKAKKAYRQVADIWDMHLGAERKRELQRRERLILQAQAQLDNVNTNDAIEMIKQLQQQWSPTVGLKRREQEQALWQRFKTACDTVFVRHGEQRAQAKDAENVAFADYQAQIQALALILDDEGHPFEHIKAEFYQKLQMLRATDSTYHNEQQPSDNQDNLSIQRPRDFVQVSGKAAHALRAQLAEVVQRFEQRENEAISIKRDTQLQRLLQQDNLCSRLELTTADHGQLGDLEQQWAVIQPPLNDGQSVMHKRFDKALTALQNAQPISVDASDLNSAQEICLLLELSADIASPKSAQNARETLRLAMLDAAMNGDKSFEQYQTEQGLYDLTLRWAILPKAGLTQSNSGTSLANWQQRFTQGLQQARACRHLSPLKQDDNTNPTDIA